MCWAGLGVSLLLAGCGGSPPAGETAASGGTGNTGGTTGTTGVCGDGVVDRGESCDDGNQDPWDGCTLCKAPGDLLWSVNADCGSKLVPGKNDSILQICGSGPNLYRRFEPLRPGATSPTTELYSELGPPSPWTSPEYQRSLVELDDGTLFATTIATATDATGVVSAYRLNERGEVLWKSGPVVDAVTAGSDEWLAVGGRDVLSLLSGADGTVQWTVPLEKSRQLGFPIEVAAAALAVDAEGTTYFGGVQGGPVQRLGTIWAYDVAGKLLWKHEDEFETHAADLRLRGDELRALLQGRRYVTSAASQTWLSLKALDLRTGEVLADLEPWSGTVDQNTSLNGRFSFSSAFESYVFGPGGFSAFDTSANQVFDARLALQGDPVSTIALLGVVCEIDGGPLGKEPRLNCYLTQ